MLQDQDVEEVKKKKKQKSYLVQLSAFFPDASKAEDFFHKFDQMDDTSIFDALTLLLDELTFTKAQTIRVSPNFYYDWLMRNLC